MEKTSENESTPKESGSAQLEANLEVRIRLYPGGRDAAVAIVEDGYTTYSQTLSTDQFLARLQEPINNKLLLMVNRLLRKARQP